MNNKQGKEELSLLKKSKQLYPKSPKETKLECFKNLYKHHDYWIEFSCPEFTSLCPITAQPDFGKIIIRYKPKEFCIESKSLKFYLFSFRTHPSFHEEVVNQILNDCLKACHPEEMIVEGQFRPRGGISLNVKAYYPPQKA